MAVEQWVNEEGLKLTEIVARIPFDPRTEVSADAKYIVKQIVLWFLVAPVVFGLLGFIAYNALH